MRTVKLRKRGKRYYARYYDPNRPAGDRRCERSLKTGRKEAAEREIVEKRRQFRNGTYDPWNPDDRSGEQITFDTAADRFLEHKSHLRPKTVKAYRVALEGLDIAPGVLLRGIDPRPLRDYVVHDRSVTVATRRKRHRHLKAFFRWCVSEGYLETSPLDKVTPPKAQKKNPEFLTPDQLRTLLRCIDADCELKVVDDKAQPGQIRWLKDVIVLAVNTGMRLGELTSLQWGAIDFSSGFIDVSSSEDSPTKSGSERRIPMTEDARDLLRRLEFERQGHGPGEPVLKGYTGGPLNGSYTSKRFKHYVRKAKLPERFCFHSLRHTCASWLVQRGVSLPMVQEILGHADATTTQRYAHMAPDALKQAMSVLDDA